MHESEPQFGQDVAMRGRPISTLIVISLLVASCAGGSGDGVATTTTKLTLLPTTTTTEAPVETEPPATEPVVESTATPTTATTAPTTTTIASEPTVPPPPVDPLVDALELSVEGVGAAVFSAEPDGVIAYLNTIVGPPTGDTGWVDPFEISACSGTELRVVTWGGLQLTFGDFSPVLEGRRHFFSFRYGTYDYDGSVVTPGDETPPGLITSRGVGLGTTLVDVEAAYPGLEINPSDPFVPDNFVVNDNLRGFLSGLGDDATVVALIGGADCANPT